MLQEFARLSPSVERAPEKHLPENSHHATLGELKAPLPKLMKTPYEIQYETFAAAGGLYTDKHARLYAQFADDLIANGSFSIVYEGVAHACYTPITIDAAPHLKCYVLSPMAVLPAYQRQGYATRLMDLAESQLDADVIFVMGEAYHYKKRYNAVHDILPPIHGGELPEDCWFARELTPGALDGVGRSTTTITGPYADPNMWTHPDDQTEPEASMN